MVCDFFGVSTSVSSVNSKAALNSGTGTSSVSSISLSAVLLYLRQNRLNQLRLP
jgi:hypothetical protein